MTLSPEEIQAGLSIARTVASYTPVSTVVCPVLDVTGMALGGYTGRQTQRAQDEWQNTVVSGLQVMQGSIAVIGLGTAAGVALSAVNLHQTLQLRKDVKRLSGEVKDGFIDVKQALKDQGAEVIRRIDEVARDVEFRHHRTILAQAYGLFAKAMERFHSAIKLSDANLRNSQINGALDMLYKALADYDSNHLMEGTCSAGQLRRQECVWTIEQAITTIFQFQGEHKTVSDRLSKLQDKIRQDSLTVIDRCQSEDELDFLFPEILRIQTHDIAVLESWQHHVDWMRELAPAELKQLQEADLGDTEVIDTQQTTETTPADLVPPEQTLYENLKQKSHYLSLRDQLKFAVKPDLRQGHESYIGEQATATGYKGLAPSNWQDVTNLTLANLYWYFKSKDESEAPILS